MGLGFRAALFVFLAAPLSARAPQSSTLNRPADPVVLTGAAVPSLVGSLPGDIVAFRYASGWQQIPVQVDERADVDLRQVYNNIDLSALVYGGLVTVPPVVVPCYTDPNTWTGADPNSALDADDEIAFMARDAGDRPPAFSEPAGVAANSGVEVTVTDSVGGGTGYVYLFRRSGTSLSPGAGQTYVTYSFTYAANYKTNYNLSSGPNPENSSILTPYYRHHFSDRWVDDELNFIVGGSPGTDLLDRHKNLFAPDE